MTFKKRDEAEASAVITTYSGAHIDLLNPDPALIVIDDIAAALAKINRFCGHTPRDYSVAEHLLLGVDYVVPEHRFKWFTHDFSEAYLGDVSGPLKRIAGMEVYRTLEAKWEIAIGMRFGIPEKGWKEVKGIDQRMLVTEQRDLMGRRPLSIDKFKPFDMHIGPVAMSSAHLQERFLATFYALAAATPGAIR